MASPTQKKFGPLFLALFALPFLGVGLFMGGLALRTLHQAQLMAHWPEASATILETRLVTSQGDSTTYRAEARFQYEVDGVRYESSRVGLSQSSDNIGHWQQDRYRELESARASGTTLPCRVNPADPSDAILFPEARPSMVLFHGLFVVMFGGIGGGAIWYGIRQFRRQKIADSAPPDAPWTRRTEWAAGLIPCANRQQAAFIVFFAVVWNLISWPIVFMSIRDALAQGGPAFLVLLFPAVGLGLAAWAVREVMVVRRYGKAVFQMAAVPGVLGGRLAGLIRLPESARPEEGFVVSIACERTYSSGKNSHTETMWKDERRLDASMVPTDDQGQALPVLFALPYELPESEEWFNRGRVNWRLRVKGRQPGVDVDLVFELPVFKTPASLPNFRLDEKPIAAFEQKT